jgi:hypothetical protein
MKKLVILTLLVAIVFAFTPGYANEQSFQNFMTAVKAQEKISGRAEVRAETKIVVIYMFGLKEAMKKFKYDKETGETTVTMEKKFDEGPSVWDQTPSERLEEALKIYDGRG